MRFIDYNGTGGLDSQDLITSVAVEEAALEDAPEERASPERLSSNAGCATMAALIALPILAIIVAL